MRPVLPDRITFVYTTTRPPQPNFESIVLKLSVRTKFIMFICWWSVIQLSSHSKHLTGGAKVRNLTYRSHQLNFDFANFQRITQPSYVDITMNLGQLLHLKSHVYMLFFCFWKKETNIMWVIIYQKWVLGQKIKIAVLRLSIIVTEQMWPVTAKCIWRPLLHVTGLV